MKFIIEPYHSVGFIKFGMSRDDVYRMFCRESSSVIRRYSTHDLSSDHLEEFGIFVFYSDDQKVECVEFMLPSDHSLELFGIELIGLSVSELYNNLCKIDTSAKIDEDYVFYSKKIGLTAYPSPKEKVITAMPESIYLSKKGLWLF